MVIAMRAIMRYSMKVTGRCCERAKVRSNAILCIGLKKKVKSKVTTAANIPRSMRSQLSIVNMLPNRNDERSGINPGVRKQHIIPILMPSVQKRAIAESSRTPPFREIH